ncbi:MAG: insulinase family protein [Armatimonadota bacterium]|nr:insulinase family protein [Armatimonadota bacterium]
MATTYKPAPGHVRLFDPATIFHYSWPNGVRAVVKETQGTGLVTVQVWVRAGSRYETAMNNGVSHLIEDLALRGSKNYPRLLALKPGDAIGGGATDALEALGGSVSSQTSRDATFYSATVAASSWPEALRTLADATLHPTLTDVAIEDSRADVQEDVQSRAGDPLASVADLAYAVAFTKHPYRRPAGGTPESVDALTGAQVRAYYKARYVGPNISVIVVGDVQHAMARTLIGQNFSAAPGAAKQSAAPIPTESMPLSFKSASRRRIDMQNVMLGLAYRAPGIKSPRDVVVMDVLLAHWSEGSDAALRRVLRGATKASKSGADETPEDADDEKDDAAPGSGGQAPLALAFNVDFLTQRDPGLFIVALVVRPQDRTKAVQATLEEIGRVQKQGIDAAALQRAKTALVQQYIEQGETVSGQAGALGFYEIISDYKFAQQYLDYVTSITLADVKRVAGRYLSKTSYVQAVVEPMPRPRQRPPGSDSGTITARAERSHRQSAKIAKSGHYAEINHAK